MSQVTASSNMSTNWIGVAPCTEWPVIPPSEEAIYRYRHVSAMEILVRTHRVARGLKLGCYY